MASETNAQHVKRVVDFIFFMEVGGEHSLTYLMHPFMSHTYTDSDRNKNDSSQGPYGLTTIAIQDVDWNLGDGDPESVALLDKFGGFYDVIVANSHSNWGYLNKAEFVTLCCFLLLRLKRRNAKDTIASVARNFSDLYSLHFGNTLSSNQLSKIDKYTSSFGGVEDVGSNTKFYIDSVS